MPSFKEAGLSSPLRSASGDLIASANLVRSEAIKRNALVSLCVSTDGETCGAGWEQGWIVTAGGPAIQKQSAAPTVIPH